jgi:Mg-chelatase subunit ChlD
MRLIKIDLPQYYYGVVKQGLANHQALQQFGEDFFCDVLSIIAMGGKTCGKFFITAKEMAVEIGELYRKNKITSMPVCEAEKMKLRMDLIEFAEAPFVEEFRNIKVLTLEEKFEIMLNILQGMYDSAQKYKGKSDPNSPNYDPYNPASQQSQAAPTVSGNAGGGKTQINSAFFKGFSHIFGAFTDVQNRPSLGGDGADKGVGAEDEKFRDSVQNKMNIAKFVDNFYARDYFKIFHIAKNLGKSFATSKTGKFEDTERISSNLSMRRMRKQSDIVRANKMDVALGDDYFDRKLAQKSLRVASYRERRDKKQCLYALADRSGSTGSGNRIQFIKGVLIGLGKKALQDKSVFYCRWFDGSVKSLYILRDKRDWPGFLSYVLNQTPAGGTDIDFAMQTAVKDIDGGEQGLDKTDILVVTDGTEDIHEPTYADLLEHKNKGKKFHFVLLEDIMGDRELFSQKLSESFQYMDSNKAMQLDDYVPEFRTIVG